MGKGQSKSYDISGGEVNKRSKSKSNRNSERISKISLNGSQPVEANGTSRDSTVQEAVNQDLQHSQEAPAPKQEQEIATTETPSDTADSKAEPTEVKEESEKVKEEIKEEEKKEEKQEEKEEEHKEEDESQQSVIQETQKETEEKSPQQLEDTAVNEVSVEEKQEVAEDTQAPTEDTAVNEVSVEEKQEVAEDTVQAPTEELESPKEVTEAPPDIVVTSEVTEVVETDKEIEIETSEVEVTQEVTQTETKEEQEGDQVVVTCITVTSEDTTVTQETPVEYTTEKAEVEQEITVEDTTEPPPEQETQEEVTVEMADTVEAVVCDAGDLKDGDMKEVELGEGKVLLVKEGDEIHAMGHKCTHYGAPLVKGVHCNGQVRCPWHGACFNVKTGDIEDFPGLDSVPKFEVNVDEGKVKVKAKKSELANHKLQKSMCKAADDTDQSLLIIGGGPASVECAETLRKEGYTGKIAIATREATLPYDRPVLSKKMDVKPEFIVLRPAEFYNEFDINVMTNREATKVDPGNKTVTFSDGSTETYKTLLLATGGKPRTLPIPGADLKNVCQLRTPEDANFIAENAKGKNVVIIGSSFIGLEVASFLADKAASVSVVDIIKVPFQLILGEKIGAVLQKMHEEKGVKFHFERGIKAFEGEDGTVKEAVLSDDTRLPADLCILGVGVVPATEFLKDSGIEMNSRGFVSVDKKMMTNQPDVYAAGDIVEFPLFSVEDQKVNIQHWQMAHKQGQAAAHGIMGNDKDIKSVPFFWTMMYGKSIRYTGYGPGYDDVVVHGDLDAPKFVAYYTKGDEVVAVASMNFDPIVAQAAELMYSGKKIMKSEVLESEDGWVAKL